MISKMQVMDSLLGKPIVDALVQTLYNQTEDFPAIHQAYLAAIERLHTELRPDARRSIQKYTAAIEQICASNLYHAGIQGLKMNYDHFVNPMIPNCTWKQVDYDDYLRPHIADSLPLYETAYKYKEQFEKQLPPELKEAVTEAVISYETALECSGMKLAHYYGYLMGNDLLRHCIPGYYSDMVLDINYTRMLEAYFGHRLSMDQWEGCCCMRDWKVAPIPEEDPQDTLILREEIWKDQCHRAAPLRQRYTQTTESHSALRTERTSRLAAQFCISYMTGPAAASWFHPSQVSTNPPGSI